MSCASFLFQASKYKHQQNAVESTKICVIKTVNTNNGRGDGDDNNKKTKRQTRMFYRERAINGRLFSGGVLLWLIYLHLSVFSPSDNSKRNEFRLEPNTQTCMCHNIYGVFYVVVVAVFGVSLQVFSRHSANNIFTQTAPHKLNRNFYDGTH